MTEQFSQKEWAREVLDLATKLCLRKSDLARLLGESRFHMSHMLSEIRGVPENRLFTYRELVSFLKFALVRDGIFKKDIREPARKTVERRNLYVAKLADDFDVFLKKALEKENENVTKTITG